MNAIEKTKEILKGIDEDEAHTEDGWWETSGGVRFGADKLKEMLALVSQQQAEIEELKTMRGNSVLVPSDKLTDMQAEIEVLRQENAFLKDWQDTWAPYIRATFMKDEEKCNGFCGEYECKENQPGCKRRALEK